MKLVKLTQCLEQDKSALHPVWVNPAFIVALDRTPFGTTQVRTAIGVGWVVETPEDIELQLLPIHFDVEMVNEKANEQAPVEGAYPPRARHTGIRDD